MTIENTSQRDPMLNLLGMLGEGASGYIEGMEAAGQRQVVESTRMPARAPWDELTALGFVKGNPVPRDDLFVEATLPEGWKREGSDHAMWSYIVDERGVRRVSVFYKAAFYDRDAFANTVSVAGTIATDVEYGDEAVTLPATWDVLTDDEKTSVVEALRARREENEETARQYPGLNEDGRYTRYIERAGQFIALAEAALT